MKNRYGSDLIRRCDFRLVFMKITSQKCLCISVQCSVVMAEVPLGSPATTLHPPPPTPFGLLAQQSVLGNDLDCKDLMRAIQKRSARQLQNNVVSTGPWLQQGWLAFCVYSSSSNTCCSWLLTEGHKNYITTDQVVLEQFITRVPIGITESGVAAGHLAAYLGPSAGHPFSLFLFLSFLLFPSPSTPERREISPTSGYKYLAASLFVHPPFPTLSALPLSSATQRMPFESTGTWVRPDQMCWCWKEPWQLQHQCHMIEVGTFVWLPEMP